MRDYRLARLVEWQEAQRALVEKVRTTPLEEWHLHPDIMEKVKREGFDIQAAIARRNMGDSGEATLDVSPPKRYARNRSSISAL